MQIIETIVEPIIEENGWRVTGGVKVCVGIGIVIIAIFLVFTTLFLLSRIGNNDFAAVCAITPIAILLVAIIAGAAGTGNYQIGETVKYRVRLDDTYPANKLIKQYDIIDYKDGIWTITEKGE